MSGRHRAHRKSQVGPVLIKTGAVIAMASAPTLLSGATAEAASPDSILAAIASCESGGKNIPTSLVDSNGKRLSTASGYFQIVNGTWRAHGGLAFAPTALGATYAEQRQVAENILLRGQGIGAWSESKNCWSKRIGKVPVSIPKPVVKAPVKAPVKVAPAPTPAPKVTAKKTPPVKKVVAQKVAATYLIKSGDTLSGIAKVKGTTVKKLAAVNRDTVKNVDLIFAGNRLRLR